MTNSSGVKTQHRACWISVQVDFRKELPEPGPCSEGLKTIWGRSVPATGRAGLAERSFSPRTGEGLLGLWPNQQPETKGPAAPPQFTALSPHSHGNFPETSKNRGLHRCVQRCQIKKKEERKRWGNLSLKRNCSFSMRVHGSHFQRSLRPGRTPGMWRSVRASFWRSLRELHSDIFEFLTIGQQW